MTEKTDTPVLKTERLVLRGFEPAEAERLARLIGEFEVAGNLARVPYPYSVADAKEWLTSLPAMPQPHRTTFAIATENDGLIGAVGFHEADGAMELGYWLGRAWWGHLYAGEAAFAALQWLFSTTTEASVHSGAFHFNAASLAIQRKLGFVVTGRSMSHNRARNEEVEHIDTLLTREAFEAVRHLHAEQAGRNEKKAS